MGEMTIRNVDDALLVELERLAEIRGIQADVLAAELLWKGLGQPMRDRAAGAKAILAAQPTRSPIDSVNTIREDRAR